MGVLQESIYFLVCFVVQKLQIFLVSCQVSEEKFNLILYASQYCKFAWFKLVVT